MNRSCYVYYIGLYKNDKKDELLRKTKEREMSKRAKQRNNMILLYAGLAIIYIFACISSGLRSRRFF